MAKDKILILADLSNLYFCTRSKYGRRVDYKKFLEACAGKNKNFRAIAYGAETEGQADAFKATLCRLGFEIKFMKPKVFKTGVKKADWDVGIVVDAMRLAESFDIIVFGTADGDLAPCLKHLGVHKRKKIIIVVVGCGISYELKNYADSYIEIDERMLE